MSRYLLSPSPYSLVEMLCQCFPKDRVKIYSEYHLAVLSSPGKHEIWLPKHGPAKLKLAGNRQTEVVYGGVEEIIRRIQDVEFGKVVSDIRRAREALDLAALITAAQRLLPPDQREAIFVDAGWKDGIAQIGFVHIQRVEHGFNTAAGSWPAVCSSSRHAEQEAIEYGASFAPKSIVYSDCKDLVDSLNSVYGGRLRWLPREQNKAADAIANRRKESTTCLSNLPPAPRSSSDASNSTSG